VSKPDLQENKSNSTYYKMPVKGGNAEEITNAESYLSSHNLSPNGEYSIHTAKVKLGKVLATDYYPEMKKAEVQIYDGLHYRHWDTWMDGTYNHIFYSQAKGSRAESTP